MICNGILLVGVGLTCIPNFYALVIGRIIYGYSAGLFSFLTPKYISEVAPVEVSGIFGGVSQLACTIGILLPSLLNPFEDDIE
jgi:MFS family permease